MAFEDSNTTMLVQPAGGNGFGGFGGDGNWAWIILLLLAFGGGWGMGGFGGFGGGDLYPWLNNSQNINGGFRDQMLGTQLMGIQNSLTGGFGDVQNSLCAGFAGVNATVNGAQNAITQQLYTNQIADMQQTFGVQSALQNCCCENRAGLADLKYSIATENCADRAALSDGIRDLLAATQAQTQTILDKMCQDKIDAKNELIVQLNNRINALEANNYVQNAITAQTQYFVNRYPVPTTPTTGA